MYLLMAAIVCSSVAGAADSCGVSDAASGAAASIMQDSSAHHHGSATEKRADSTECPCCDDCAVACVFSACNPAATAFFSINTNYDRANRFEPVVTSAHEGPVLHPPFRPPIV